MGPFWAYNSANNEWKENIRVNTLFGFLKIIYNNVRELVTNFGFAYDEEKEVLARRLSEKTIQLDKITEELTELESGEEVETRNPDIVEESTLFATYA